MAAGTGSTTVLPNGGFVLGVAGLSDSSQAVPGTDYSLQAPYRAADATTPSGVDFNSPSGLNAAIATTLSGLAGVPQSKMTSGTKLSSGTVIR